MQMRSFTMRDNAEALQLANAVLSHPELDPRSEIEAQIVRITALAQSGELVDALRAHSVAEELALRKGNADQVLRLTHVGVVVLFHNGRIGDAVDAARRSGELTRAVGDLVEAIQVDGNLCTLLMVCGETGQAYELARRLRHQHATMGSSTNSNALSINLVNLLNSAAWHGQLDEAVDALDAAAVVSDEQAAPQTRTVVRISSAYLWLTLGDASKAAAALPMSVEGMPPDMQIRWHWVRARIAVLDGRPSDDALAAIGRIQSEHPHLSHGESAWLEWSWQGDAREVVERLRVLRQQAALAGRHGFARATMVRELDRLAEIDDAEAARAAANLAAELGILPTVACRFRSMCLTFG